MPLDGSMIHLRSTFAFVAPRLSLPDLLESTPHSQTTRPTETKIPRSAMPGFLNAFVQHGRRDEHSVVM